MKRRLMASIRAIAATAAVLSLVTTVTIGGQGRNFQPPAGGPDWTPPLNAYGDPDIEGRWTERSDITTYSIQAGLDDRDEHTQIGGQRPQLGEPIMTPDKKIPYLPWAATFADFLHEQHYGAWTGAYLDPVSRGLLEGLPRLHYQGAMEIYQFPDYISVSYAYGHAYRIIYTDGRPHPPSNVKLWMGDSRGHWEGDTFVSEVTKLNGQSWFDIVGSFSTDALTMVERWKFSGPERIDYEVTMTDPNAYREPWTMGMVLAKTEYEEMWPSEVWEGTVIADTDSLSIRPPQ